MSRHIVGLVDYGAGNCTSVRTALKKLGVRSRLVKCYEDFSGISTLLIPGVGAFPSAMKALNEMELVEPICEYAHQGRPIVGVCLGMQLLAEASHELGYTRGLGLIPGEVQAISLPEWHIGWNTLEVVLDEAIASGSDGCNFYFNHSFEFQPPSKYVVGIVRSGKPIVAVVRKNNIYGFQFHPEKSQNAGIRILEKALKELSDA